MPKRGISQSKEETKRGPSGDCPKGGGLKGWVKKLKG